jgi:hypothetical protein
MVARLQCGMDSETVYKPEILPPMYILFRLSNPMGYYLLLNIHAIIK